ncbi:SDR family oxidoreductase [Neptunicella marina]|uniref:SDR family oxidoreductase n=1 Tax=Neptunicella marina TaxID=2125989 RepID=A0A8J6IT79_9ALTE|nr:SDR family oxidoreductase [Neptunicella marina]MBC3767005.1 SDR family oxidoreductase [Neptunicella marina]
MANVLITGANRGIGLALTQQFIKRNDTVFAVCRHPSPELEKSGATIISGVNMTEPAGFQRVQEALGKNTIDILINNAGVLGNETINDMDCNRMMYQFQVNALAPVVFTQFLLSQLAQHAKIVMITSRMGSMADNGSGGYYGYRMSKAALNAGAVSLANDLKASGFSVAILHPGFVQTDMVGGAGDVSAEQSAQGLVERIDQLSIDNTGTFWHANGDVLPW